MRTPLRRAWPFAVAALCCFLLGLSPWWRSVELRFFDVLTRLSAPGPAKLPITLITIDEESIAALGSQLPWPRSVHAQLLERLREAEVAVVAFDLLFSEPAGNPADDLAFEQAIRAAGPVILVANLDYRETSSTRLWVRIDPLPRFTEAGALPGLATVELDSDGVLRRFPQSAEALWRQLALRLDALQPGVVAQLDAQAGQYIRYLDRPPAFLSIPYYQLLDPVRYLDADWKEALRDNVVLVGRTVKTASEIGTIQSDLFFTPFFASSGAMTPGVEIHATLLANMVSGTPLRELSPAYAHALLIVVALCAGLLTVRWRPWRSALLAGALTTAVAAGSAGLFSLGYWLPAGTAMLVAPLTYLLQGSQAFLREQARRRGIRRAFAHYVSPAVVDIILANPEKLRLGGERCELTVMFTDLAGFTSIAEGMDSDAVTALLNRHLADMSEIVIRHGGTVDKFIGDAVMAFWGAPVADPQQADHALAAALEMQLCMAATRNEAAVTGGPALRMRIGIHQGECIAGNMGGSQRFSYTAVGDTVNLAARLESANKIYGTDILLSGSVVAGLAELAGLAGTARLRQVDSVRVVGKRQPIDIYTPCADPTQCELSTPILEAYRRADISAALTACNRLSTAFPNDPVATVFRLRLEEWQEHGVPADWDGITTLKEK